MLYGIIADIHGNSVAFDAVLKELEAAKPDQLLCLGDVVGYGADPIGCIERIRDRDIPTVVGNHDAAAFGGIDPGYFNYEAQASIQWTIEALAPSHVQFLRELPWTFEADGFIGAHGSLSDPKEFEYILTFGDATECIKAQGSPLSFVAHSHVPVSFMTDGKDVWASMGAEYVIPKNAQAVINVGSVGQPRDGDPRAAYALYDSDAGKAQILRVEYDVDAAAGQIEEAGLPASNAHRLYLGR